MQQHRNFHVPLPDDLYQVIRVEAERRRLPATVLVREALEQWVKRLRAEILHSEITEYAAQHAGSPADIDVEMEAAGIESLTGIPSKVKRAPTRAKHK